MGMEPFDYLTYKQNKRQDTAQKRPVRIKVKKSLSFICMCTFIGFFFIALIIVGSKSSKVDIEYANSENSDNPYMQTLTSNNESDIDEEIDKNEKYTIDKRLFAIQQEEKGPSKSKIVDEKEQTEVISSSEFDKLKTNSEDILNNVSENLKNLSPVKENLQNNVETKLAMKPKIQPKPIPKQLSALDIAGNPSKVLIGKFYNLDDAKEAQSVVAESIGGTVPFVKKINGYYSVQIGSFDNFETAKTVAIKYRAKGFDAWILQ